MKPLYVKKNGVVYKISGNGMPASYPAADVEYDNTVTSELQATDVQSAIDELSTRQGGVQSDWNEDDSAELDYIKNKPENLVQDANYVHTDNNYDNTAKGKVDSLGTASTKDVGVANGVAELDAAGKVPSSQLPSFVDDVIEVADYDHLPITGESGKIYVTLDTNKTYRWTGSGYVEISESLALGETSSTAYRGDRGKTAYDHATETKLSTATASGLYKVAATAQGHIASLTAVQKSDITALGIPGSDTDTKNTAYGTCDTAGDVKDKVATLVNATNWSLEVGTIVGIRFTYTNTYTNQLNSRITLNINNTGAKTIRYSNDIWTSSFDKVNPTAYGESDQTIYYMYDGTYWVWVSHSKDNDTLYNFKGNEFRSADGNNYGQETGYGGNANYMVVNGHYYYNSNGPSTDIGASANDGAIYVQALDEDNVAQIAQNYENGNLFVRGKANGTWTDWKRPSANIISNNAVLTTDKTPFLTRQTLNPTGFSGYVREKLIGASYAWNQLLNESEFTDQTSGLTVILSNHKLTINGTTTAGSNYRFASGKTLYAGHKYALFGITKFTSSSSTLGRVYVYNSNTSTICVLGPNLTSAIFSVTTTANYNIYYNIGDANITVSFEAYMQLVDLTLAFGSTIADYLYGLSNNGGITKLRDMGCPIDKYNPYGNYLISSKTSGKRITINQLGTLIKASRNASTGGTVSVTNRITTEDFYDLKAGTTYCIFGKTSTSGKTLKSSYSLWTNKSTTNNIRTYDTGWITEFPIVITPTEDKIFTCTFAFTDDSTITLSELDAVFGGAVIYPLGNDELRGKFDLVNGEIVASGDVKESNGGITRNWKLVDLGSLNYDYISNGTFFQIQSVMSDIKASAIVLSAKYVNNVPSSVNSDNMIIGVTTSKYLRIRDTAYTDATTFKTALNGVYAIIELATPTTEQSTPFADPMSLVGATTEEYIDTRDIPCPVGAERQYMGQSEDVVEIPSSPQSDGKRILISEVSGGKEQVYWDTLTKLNYHDYTVKGDGTTTWGDLLNSLRPIYESLSEDEKTFSKLIFRPESISGNECLSYCGAYWYSRMGLNSVNNALWIDHASLGPNSGLTYYYQKQGDTFIDKTSQTTTYSLSLRVFVEVGNNS